MASQKILIVDDSKTIRAQVREMLSKGNFEVAEAADGLEGLEFIRNERPNLVLLDFFMPRMNGWEVLLRIQSLPDLQMIPIVVMTGRKTEVQEKVPELFKYFEFIEKPFDPRTLINAVRAAMAKAMSRQSVPYAIAETASAKVPTSSFPPSSTPPTSGFSKAVSPQATTYLDEPSQAICQNGTVTLDISSTPVDGIEPVGAVVSTITPSITHATAIPPDAISSDTLNHLRAEVEILQQGNAKLETELENLKKQMTQLMTFIKQKFA